MIGCGSKPHINEHPNFLGNDGTWMFIPQNMVTKRKQDAAHEPQCSHVEHIICETNYLNSLHFFPATVHTSAL